MPAEIYFAVRTPYTTTPLGKIQIAFGIVTLITLVALGIIGATGAIAPHSLGLTTLCLGSSLMVHYVCMYQVEKCKVYALFLSLGIACLVILGGLGAANVLSAKQIGWGVIGSMYGAPFLTEILYLTTNEYKFFHNAGITALSP